MKPPPSLRELPPLPEPYGYGDECSNRMSRSMRRDWRRFELFTAEQMKAYALAAMEDKKCPVGIDWCPLGKEADRCAAAAITDVRPGAALAHPPEGQSLSDEQILALWSPPLDSAVQRPILGKNKILAFARALLSSTAPRVPRLDVRPCALCHTNETGFVCTGRCEEWTESGTGDKT